MEIKGRNEGGERGILMLSFFGEFGRESCKEGFLVGDFEGIQQLGALYSVWARGSKGVPLELGGRRDLASWQGGKTSLGWLSFRAWEGLLAAGKSKEKRQARTSTTVDLLAIYRYFSAVYMAILFI